MNHEAPPRSVLLTGATGSLGGQLCAELLASTSATVYCLVRGADPAAAAERLARRLRQVDDRPDAGERLIVLPADFERPGLGLSGRDYDALAETVDAIIHSAANVNLAADYARLAPVNVGGTRSLIAFARRRAELTGQPAGFHHVSTLSVLVGARSAGLDEVDENTAPSLATAGRLGYPRSKAAAELELRVAARDGLPVTVFRPGLVTGYSRTGRTSGTDVLVPMLRAAVALGTAPTGPDVVPADMIDVVARGIVALIWRADTTGRAFHLIRAEPLRLADVFDALRRAGHRLDPVEPDDWWSQLQNHPADPAVRPMAAMAEAGRYLLALDPAHRPPRFRSEATRAALRTAGVPAPPLDGAFFDRLVTGLHAMGDSRPAPTPRSGGTVAEPTGNRVQPAPDPGSLRVDGMVSPLSFAGADRFPDAAGAAAACEAAGYGAFWVPEQNHDPLLALAAATAGTTSIELGTAAVIALARNPMTVATAANDLHAQSGGRLTLGIGTQRSVHLANRFSMPSDRPAARLREFVAALRAIWDCWNHERPLEFRGEFYTHTLMSPFFTPPPNPHGPPKVFLTAAGPRMAQLAGEVAAGLITPPHATRRHLAEVLMPAVERGLAKSGRPRSSFTVVCVPLVVTGRTDAERARVAARVRTLIAFWCSTPAYRSVLDPYGLGGLGDELLELSLSADRDRWSRMAERVDDTILDIFATVAPQHDVGRALHRRYAGIADRIIMPAPHGAEAGLWDTEALALDQVDPDLTVPHQ
ncbi:MAG: TIGR03617 family F420-dependent LLM class oxidoreductase [Actinophytocola sp.]|uniref:TIGR03617 family F420-dependent LLM class oxidoreductase n=1 Tax=Actinophytocola sp. TaxID=1872138 RepID=UPI00132634CF|nr:TIGR03617 family F420-dependent LLM class oxidoreductase [Actinophytocola sp.]MPZ85702.1 TIGR03617 family F420-dependent LLM class oxidoreductase [Actinophytocola sp.]